MDKKELNPPLISVIICTHNREQVVIDCCNSLAKQSIPSNLFEVVLVDNASTDSTASLLAEFMAGEDSVNFRLLSEPKVGLSHARNLGVKSAKADFIGFIDDDARAPADWLETALSIIEAESPDIFGGPALPLFPNGKPEWFHEEYAIRGDMGDTGVLKEGGFLIGTNIFFRKSLVIEYGGFDPELGMKGNNISYHEETSLINRARVEGKKIFYSKELAVKDVIPGYKLSIAFAIYSKYKAGKDLLKFEEQDMGDIHIRDAVFLMDDIMEEFNEALMNRDERLHAYPENYIFETLRHKFYYLGRMIEYFRRSELS